MAVCSLVRTFTLIGNVSIPLPAEKHRLKSMGPSSSCAVMVVGRHSYNATIHSEKWSIQQLLEVYTIVDVQMHNHILLSSSTIVTVSELGVIITLLSGEDAITLNVSSSSTKVSSVVVIISDMGSVCPELNVNVKALGSKSEAVKKKYVHPCICVK